MSGKPVLFKLIYFYARETWSSRTLTFFGLMLFLSGFLLWGMPSLSPDVSTFFPPVSFSIVDLDKSFLSRKLIEQISGIDVIDELFVEPLDEARARLEKNESLLVLVIPEEFYEISMRSEQRPPIAVYLNSQKPVETALFVRFLNNLAGSIEGVQSSYFSFAAAMRPLYNDEQAYFKVMDSATAHIVFQTLGRRSIVDISEKGKMNTVYFVISSLVCLLTMQTSLLLLAQIQQERRSGVRERLLLAGVSWWQPVLARQVVGLGLLAAGFAPLLAGIFRVFPDASKVNIIVSVILLYWITALLFQAIGNISKPNDTVLLGAWLGILALMLLGGSIYPEPLLPGLLQKAAKWTPAYWAFQTVYQGLGGQHAPVSAGFAGGLMTAAATFIAAFSWQKSEVTVQAGGKS